MRCKSGLRGFSECRPPSSSFRPIHSPISRSCSPAILALTLAPPWPLNSPSPTQYPWRATNHRWARSCRCFRELASCKPCRPIGSPFEKFEGIERLEVLAAFRLSDEIKTRWKKNVGRPMSRSSIFQFPFIPSTSSRRYPNSHQPRRHPNIHIPANPSQSDPEASSKEKHNPVRILLLDRRLRLRPGWKNTYNPS